MMCECVVWFGCDCWCVVVGVFVDCDVEWEVVEYVYVVILCYLFCFVCVEDVFFVVVV